MRMRRVVCKLCGHRGSCANKREVRARIRLVWLCQVCYEGILASTDLGTAD